MSVIYLDDILLFGNSIEACKENVKETLSLLKQLGFIVNFEKSNLSPNQTCKYLGFLYNSKTMLISLPNEKRLKLRDLLQKFSSMNRCKIREFSRFIGSLISSAPAIKYAFLYTKLFEREKCFALQNSGGNYEAEMYISPSLAMDFTWWSSKVQHSNNAIRSDNFQAEIYTDASRSGWGAYFKGHTTFGNLLNCNVLCRIDNTTAVCTINRMGSVKYENLNHLARKIWTWCQERNVYIFASYIASKANIHADRASRKIHKETEWSLADYGFKKITDEFGFPHIDLFASRLNKKCLKFVSWTRDPEAYKIDAFTFN